MNTPIVCAGAPRDQGLDQGRVWRERVRRELRGAHPGAHLGAQLGASRLARVAARWREARAAREIRRHFPQVSERAAGLARGAGVSQRRLMRGVAAELCPSARVAARASAGPLLAVARHGHGSGPLLLKGLQGSDATRPLYRRTCCDPGYASLDLTRAGLPAAVAGVNEAGLAMAVVAPSAPAGFDPAPAAPALLLIQECLQRFETAALAIAFCQARPVGGRATLLAADASGGLAGFEVTLRRQRLLTPVAGVLAAGLPVARAARIRRVVGAADPLDAAQLGALLAAEAEPAGACWFDPVSRRAGFQPGRGVQAEPFEIDVASD